MDRETDSPKFPRPNSVSNYGIINAKRAAHGNANQICENWAVWNVKGPQGNSLTQPEKLMCAGDGIGDCVPPVHDDW